MLVKMNCKVCPQHHLFPPSLVFSALSTITDIFFKCLVIWNSWIVFVSEGLGCLVENICLVRISSVVVQAALSEIGGLGVVVRRTE